jgi:hypothetical protein
MDPEKCSPEFLGYLVELVEDFQKSLKRFCPDDNGPPVADLDKTYNASTYKSRHQWTDAALTEMFDLEVLQQDYRAFKDGSRKLEDIASEHHCRDEVLIGGYSHPQLAGPLSYCISNHLRKFGTVPGAPSEDSKQIVLDLRGEEISIKGKKYPLPDTALKLLIALLEQPGAWRTDKFIAAGRRADKIIGRMPPDVGILIDRGRKGYRIPRETADAIKILRE